MKTLQETYRLPFYVRRLIWKYRPHLRDAITNAVHQKYDELTSLGRNITAEDISECVGAVVFALGDRNPRMEQLCLDAYSRGECRPLREVIDELRTSIAQSAPA